jgi:tRNA-specific 2-thiouridylase
MKKEKIVLGMSGGVDSSVAAFLLQKRGFEVHGVFMKNWDDENAICNAEDDYADALSVCNQLQVPLKKINYTKEYKERVFNQFLIDHQNGFTPNPDVLCNKEIKFDVFQKYAEKIGANKIASGHYAKIVKANGKFFICKAVDSSKDQSYFLYQLTSKILESVEFPLGNILKKDIRKIAQENNLINASKKDSTGICFIGDRKYNNFVSQFLKSNIGKIITVDGEEIGNHNGHMYFTVGQRKGLGIGARQSAFDQPWYVVNKDIDNNIVYVAQGPDHPALFSDELIADNMYWNLDIQKNIPFKCNAKVRYRDIDHSCSILSSKDDQCYIKFDHKIKAITSGQSIVLYHENGVCIGGGIIRKRNIPFLNKEINE